MIERGRQDLGPLLFREIVDSISYISSVHLLVMGSDRVNGVACIIGVLDFEASVACDFMSLHASQELSALASKHWPNDQLDVALQLGELVMSGDGPLAYLSSSEVLSRC